MSLPLKQRWRGGRKERGRGRKKKQALEEEESRHGEPLTPLNSRAERSRADANVFYDLLV